MDRDEDGSGTPDAVGRTGVVPVDDGRSDHRVALAALVTCLAIAIAILKPWGSETASAPPNAGPAMAVASSRLASALAVMPAPAPGGAATAPASASPTRPPGPSDPGGQCAVGSEWRVFSVDEARGQRSLSWDVVAPVTARDPRDLAIPTDLIVTDAVRALGFCAAADDAGRFPAAVRAWEVPPDGDPVPLTLHPIAEYAPADPRLGAVYAPESGPGVTVATAAAWAPGRYVFEVGFGLEDPEPRWFAVWIVAASPSRATPATTPGSPAVPASSPAPAPT
jgi:hypothetical protein